MVDTPASHLKAISLIRTYHHTRQSTKIAEGHAGDDDGSQAQQQQENEADNE
ncbi:MULTISPECIES: hypothetical protein [Dickeya]|uniref:hypothetical protein n=1 Tax=Dickeya TaxID=204037 RepID=UPI00039AB03C|nr:MULTISPECIES: hypothetical protein [Dickeya]